MKRIFLTAILMISCLLTACTTSQSTEVANEARDTLTQEKTLGQKEVRIGRYEL